MARGARCLLLVSMRQGCKNGGSIRRLLVVPSTAATRESVKVWVDARPGLIVIAPLWGWSMDPFLALLAENEPPARVVAFSDQLVSAMDAPLRVHYRGAEAYLPSIELLATTRFGYTLRAWIGGALAAPADASPRGVLRLLMAYRDACDGLGSRWLARPLQTQGTADHRRADARRRIRLLQSALMANGCVEAWQCGPTRRVLHALQRLHDTIGTPA